MSNVEHFWIFQYCLYILLAEYTGNMERIMANKIVTIAVILIVIIAIFCFVHQLKMEQQAKIDDLVNAKSQATNIILVYCLEKGPVYRESLRVLWEDGKWYCEFDKQKKLATTVLGIE